MNSIRHLFWNLIGKHLFACTPHNAYRYRTALLKISGMKCGRRVRARRNVCIKYPWNITAQDLVIFGDCAIVNASSPITIGKRCVISQYSMLLTTIGDTKTKGETCIQGGITIENDCWLAADTVVLPEAYVEQGVVVGARSLVQGKLPEWSICIGEPAKQRTQRSLYQQH